MTDWLGIDKVFNEENWDSLWNLIYSNFNEIWNLFLTVITLKLREGVLEYIFKPLSTKLFHTSTSIIDSNAFSDLYNFFTKFCTMLIILIFIWNSFKLILGKEATPFLTIFTKSVIGIAYLKIVPTLIKAVIWFNNQLCKQVIDFVGGEKVFEQILNPNFASLHMILFILIFIVYMIRLVFYYFGRDYLITLLALIAPFMWFLWIEDDLKQSASLWYKNFMILIFTQFVHCIELSVFSVIIISIGGSSESIWGNIQSVIFAIIAMMYMVRTPDFLKSFTSNLSTGISLGTLKNLASFITFAKERKIIGSITGKFKGGKK